VSSSNSSSSAPPPTLTEDEIANLNAQNGEEDTGIDAILDELKAEDEKENGPGYRAPRTLESIFRKPEIEKMFRGRTWESMVSASEALEMEKLEKQMQKEEKEEEERERKWTREHGGGSPGESETSHSAEAKDEDESDVKNPDSFQNVLPSTYSSPEEWLLVEYGIKVIDFPLGAPTAIVKAYVDDDTCNNTANKNGGMAADPRNHNVNRGASRGHPPASRGSTLSSTGMSIVSSGAMATAGGSTVASSSSAGGTSATSGFGVGSSNNPPPAECVICTVQLSPSTFSVRGPSGEIIFQHRVDPLCHKKLSNASEIFV
jgi:hypothetical protein